jgi:predicted nucleotidyltransferase
MKDIVIDEIVTDLRNKYKCHCIILYGSRARGDFTSKSDYDVLGINAKGKKTRIAEYDKKHNIFKDIFVVSEKELWDSEDEYFRLSDGICLVDEKSFGKKLLKKINTKYNKIFKLPEDEINARIVWYDKMLERASMGDAEGKYRAIWIVFALLEDYFVFRNIRYNGPKKVYKSFDVALSDCNKIDNLKKLIRKVIPKQGVLS